MQIAHKRFALCGVLALLFPTLLRGQALGSEALSSFPEDTQQLAYTNLAELRALPNYPQIRQRLLSAQLRDFQDFLRSTGTDSERDVDEVVLGWRGSSTDTADFFGLAVGRFEPDRARQFFAQDQSPSRLYAGFDLYSFGSGEEPADLFFTFLSSSSAAFGHLNDLKTLLDVRTGRRLPLESNSNFASWEAELEGTAPQWGIMTGKAASNGAAPLLTGGGKAPVDPAAVLGPVRTILYRVNWRNGLSTRLSILCQTPESAAALAKLLTMWRDSQQTPTTNAPPGIASFLAGMDVQVDGSRLELTTSGPIEALDQVLRTH